MSKTEIKLFKRFDILIFLLVIALAAALFLAGTNTKSNDKLIITANGTKSVYLLTKDQSISVESNKIKLTVVIENKTAYIASSECKDKVCVHSGKISKSGQIIVCAPAKVSVKISTDGGEYDGITV